MPRTARRLAALLLAAATLASLAACAPGEPEPTPSPTPTAAQTDAPIFASDEEALAAAIAAYEAYISATDAILRGDSAVDAVREFTTAGYGQKRAEELDAFLSSGLRSTGRTAFDSITLAEYAPASTPEDISMYSCTDVRATRLLNESGVDVTPGDRDVRVPVLISFEASSANAVLVSGDQLWTGENFC